MECERCQQVLKEVEAAKKLGIKIHTEVYFDSPTETYHILLKGREQHHSKKVDIVETLQQMSQEERNLL
jgi:hypothetical protein